MTLTLRRRLLRIAGLLLLAVPSACSQEAKTIALLPGGSGGAGDSGTGGLGGAGGAAPAEAGTGGEDAAPDAIVPPPHDGGTPPGCDDRDECRAPTPVCKQPERTCVQCVTNDDCASHLCDTRTNACDGCTGDQDCPPLVPHCDQSHQRCVQCLSAGQCRTNEVCAFEFHACVPICQTAADCAGSGRPICAAASRVCVECTSNLQCTNPQAPRCDISEGTCIQCESNLDCASGKCSEHFCEP